MNLNNFVFAKPTGRARSTRGRTNNVVSVQRPLNTRTSRKKSVTNTSTASSSTIKWAEESTRNSSILHKTADTSRTHSSSESDSRIILAISEGRGDATCEIGIAAIDVSKPHLILCQISDSSSYVNTLTKINILNPDEILVPLTFVNNSSTNRLLEKMKEQFKDCAITAVARSTYNRITGSQYIKQLCAQEWNAIIIPLQHKYYSLTAVAALMNYVESLLHIVYANNSLKIEYQESEGCAIIDVTTADKLELVASVNPLAVNNRYSSLFGILNFCQTRIGARTLRATILQPPCSVPDIESRLECVTALRRTPHLMASLQNTLSKLKNIDQLLSLVTISVDNHENFSPRQLNYILTLKSVLDLLEPLNEILEESPELFFQELKQTLSHRNFEVMRRLIKMVINPDSRPAKGEQGVHQRCFAIKPGVNGLLDIVRKAYSERIDDMREYVKSLGEKYNMPLTLANTNKKGYHIVLTLNQRTKRTFKISELPPEFIQVDRLPTTVTMKTDEILNLSVRIENLLVEILKMSNIMIHQLLIELRAFMGLFYKLCEDVAKLDMLQSLAQASNNLNYVKPEFNDFTEITDGRHPLLDFLCRAPPTPNSILMSKDHNLHIITGPNSSGKSIFIRQQLLLQVMAQVGSYIPATKAVFRVCDRILARVHFDDNLECGASSFVLEIKEIQYFRTVMTENTLIIIDELCRSTAVGEGTALAVAICEDLAKSKAYILMATHYIFATKMADIYLNIKNWQMETIESGVGDSRKLKFTYTLIPGVTTTKRYGLFAAETSWPSSIVAEAKKIFGKIQQCSLSTGTVQVPMALKLKHNLEAELKILKLKGGLSRTNLNEKLLEYVENLRSLGYAVHTHQKDDTSISNLADIDLSPIQAENKKPQSSGMVIYPEVVYSQDSQLSAKLSQMFNNMIKENRPIHRTQEVMEDANFRRPASPNPSEITFPIIGSQNYHPEVVYSHGGQVASGLSQTFNNVIMENRSIQRTRELMEEANFYKQSSPNPSDITFSGIGSEEKIHCSLLSVSRNLDLTDVETAVDELESCSGYFFDADDWCAPGVKEYEQQIDQKRPDDVRATTENLAQERPEIVNSSHGTNVGTNVRTQANQCRKKDYTSPVPNLHFDDDKPERLDTTYTIPRTGNLDQNISKERPEDVDSSEIDSQPNYGQKHVLVHSVHIFDRDNRLVDIQIHNPPKSKTLPDKTRPVETKQEFTPDKTLRVETKQEFTPIEGHPQKELNTGEFQMALKKNRRKILRTKRQKKALLRMGQSSSSSTSSGVFPRRLRRLRKKAVLEFGDTHKKTDVQQKMDVEETGTRNTRGDLIEEEIDQSSSVIDTTPAQDVKEVLPKKTLGILRTKCHDHGSKDHGSKDVANRKNQISSLQMASGSKVPEQEPLPVEEVDGTPIESAEKRKDAVVSSWKSKERSQNLLKTSEVKRHFSQLLERPSSGQKKSDELRFSGFMSKGERLSQDSRESSEDIFEPKQQKPPATQKMSQSSFGRKDGEILAKFSCEFGAGKRKEGDKSPNQEMLKSLVGKRHFSPLMTGPRGQSKEVDAWKCSSGPKSEGMSRDFKQSTEEDIFEYFKSKQPEALLRKKMVRGPLEKFERGKDDGRFYLDKNLSGTLPSGQAKESCAGTKETTSQGKSTGDFVFCKAQPFKDRDLFDFNRSFGEVKTTSPKDIKTISPKESSSQTPTKFLSCTPSITLQREDSFKSMDISEEADKRSNIFETSYHSDVFMTPEELHEKSLTSAKDSSGDLFVTAPTMPTKRRRASFKTPVKNVQETSQASAKIMLNVFKPPKRLSKKEIVEEYQKQMERCLDKSQDAETIEKNLKTLLKRPSVDQLRQQTYLAKIRKTDDGVVIMPAAKTEKRTRKQKRLKRNVSSNFGMSFFSDKNSAKFEECLQDKSDDSFKFFFDQGAVGLDLGRAPEVLQASGSQNTLFDFSGSDLRSGTEPRSPRNDPKLEYDPKTGSDPKTPAKTPDGYYKQHKATITSMLDKYLKKN